MFKKAYTLRISYVFISVVFFINSTAYCIYPSNKTHLRVPIQSDTYNRMQQFSDVAETIDPVRLAIIEEVYQDVIMEEFGDSRPLYVFDDDTKFYPSDISTIIDIFFELRARKGQKFIDLGAGDLRVAVIASVLFGMEATGVEKNPHILSIARKAIDRLVEKGILKKGQVKLVENNIFDYKIEKDAGIIYYYQGSDPDNQKIESKILKEVSNPDVLIVLYGHLGEGRDDFSNLIPAFDLPINYMKPDGTEVFRMPIRVYKLPDSKRWFGISIDNQTSL